MVSVRIAVCDDEQIFLDDMYEKLIAYQFQHNMNFDVVLFTDLNQLLPQINSFSIAFLDIRFNGQNLGIEWAQQLRLNGIDTLIVFCFSLRDQLQQGYGTDAVRFLFKPVSEETTAEALDACFHKMEMAVNRISLRTSDEQWRYVNTAKVIYVRSNARTRVVHLRSGEDLITFQTLKSIYDALTKSERTSEQFIYTQKSYLINLADVDGINYKYVTMTDGAQIPIARGMYLSIRKAITDFMGG